MLRLLSAAMILDERLKSLIGGDWRPGDIYLIESFHDRVQDAARDYEKTRLSSESQRKTHDHQDGT